ncbi:unnamed protein product [Gordionus sp. m RMFG-2023]
MPCNYIFTCHFHQDFLFNIVAARDDWCIPFEKLKNIRWLSSGSQSVVFIANYKGQIVAIKKIDVCLSKISQGKKKRSKDSINCSKNSSRNCMLSSEFGSQIMETNLKQLKHANVIKFYGSCWWSSNYCLIMEYCPHGQLFQFLRESENVSNTKFIKWIQQIASGMNYLHENGIVHRDLKSPNILVSHDEILKISDFEDSKHFDKINSVKMSFTGTAAWMAPEIIRNQACSEKVDVWSYGIVIWELLTLEIPYRNLDTSAIIWGVGNGTLSLPIPTTCFPGIKLLLIQCWNNLPRNRPSFKQILMHIDIAANEINRMNSTEYLNLQKCWKEEVINSSLENEYLNKSKFKPFVMLNQPYNTTNSKPSMPEKSIIFTHINTNGDKDTDWMNIRYKTSLLPGHRTLKSHAMLNNRRKCNYEENTFWNKLLSSSSAEIKHNKSSSAEIKHNNCDNEGLSLLSQTNTRNYMDEIKFIDENNDCNYPNIFIKPPLFSSCKNTLNKTSKKDLEEEYRIKLKMANQLYKELNEIMKSLHDINLNIKQRNGKEDSGVDPNSSTNLNKKFTFYNERSIHSSLNNLFNNKNWFDKKNDDKFILSSSPTNFVANMNRPSLDLHKFDKPDKNFVSSKRLSQSEIFVFSLTPLSQITSHSNTAQDQIHRSLRFRILDNPIFEGNPSNNLKLSCPVNKHQNGLTNRSVFSEPEDINTFIGDSIDICVPKRKFEVMPSYNVLHPYKCKMDTTDDTTESRYTTSDNNSSSHMIVESNFPLNDAEDLTIDDLVSKESNPVAHHVRTCCINNKYNPSIIRFSNINTATRHPCNMTSAEAKKTKLFGIKRSKHKIPKMNLLKNHD